MFEPTTHYKGTVAERYEHDRERTSKWQREQAVVENLLERACVRRGNVVADVPAGTGRFFPTYDTLGCSVIGIDVSPSMAVLARGKLSDLRQIKVLLHVGSITELPISSDHVTASVCVRFMNLVPFQVVERAVAELARISRSHVIVGVRVKEPAFRLSGDTGPRHLRFLWARFKMKLRAWIRKEQKVTPHPRKAVLTLFEKHHLAVEAQELIDRWADGSRYFMYLLRVER